MKTYFILISLKLMSSSEKNENRMVKPYKHTGTYALTHALGLGFYVKVCFASKTKIYMNTRSTCIMS